MASTQTQHWTLIKLDGMEWTPTRATLIYGSPAEHRDAGTPADAPQLWAIIDAALGSVGIVRRPSDAGKHAGFDVAGFGYAAAVQVRPDGDITLSAPWRQDDYRLRRPDIVGVIATAVREALEAERARVLAERG